MVIIMGSKSNKDFYVSSNEQNKKKYAHTHPIQYDKREKFTKNFS